MKSTYLFCPIVSKSFTTIPREDEVSSGMPLKSNCKICPQKSYENKKAVKRTREYDDYMLGHYLHQCQPFEFIVRWK